MPGRIVSENPIESLARRYFESDRVVSHYLREGHRVGLWESEKRILGSAFDKMDRILDLGCGTGRIAFGLERLGFQSVIGVDFSAGMVEGAQRIADGTGSGVVFQQADARDLPFGEDAFDGVVFGFNGFFMIPGVKERINALKEIYRVLKIGGRFIFTGHDRNLRTQRGHWEKEAAKFRSDEDARLGEDFGDVVAQTELGTMYIHSTTEKAVALLLQAHGFGEVESWLRSELGNEDSSVRAFSDECRFWKTVKVG